MIAYPKNLLEHTSLVEEAWKLKKGGFINSQQYQTIQSQLPSLKTQKSWWIRGGLFLVGLFLCCSIAGVIALFSYSMLSLERYGFVAWGFAAIAVGGLEWMTRSQKYFGYGIDDAFLLSAQVGISVGLYSIVDAMGLSSDWTTWIWLVGTTVVLALFAMRYLNVLSTLCACVGVIAVAGYWWVEYYMVFAPFVALLTALLMGLGFQFLKRNAALSYYLRVLDAGVYCSYILFYLSANIWVIFYLSQAYYYEQSQFSAALEFSVYFYWLFSFITPVFYLVFAVKKRDKALLWIGGLALFFSLYNVFQFTHWIGGPWWLTLGGLLLFSLAFLAIRKLRSADSGLTFQADQLSDDPSFADAEALMVIAQLGLKPELSSPAPDQFGGGGFSGGGAGGEF